MNLRKEIENLRRFWKGNYAIELGRARRKRDPRRLVIVRSSNGSRAPFIDDCYVTGYTDDTRATEKWRANGKAISLQMKRDKYGERLPGPTLVIALKRPQYPRTARTGPAMAGEVAPT